MSDGETEFERTRVRGRRFSEVLACFAKTVRGEHVDLGTIIQFMGTRSIAGLLLILALPMALPIPAPGVSVVFGVPLILISVQLLLKRRRAWIPARLARRSISTRDFTEFVERALPILRRLERIIRPRWSWLAGEWTMVPIGAICLVLAVVITLPLPLGHMLPGTAISLLALGLLERDGLAVGIGLGAAGFALVIVVVAANGVAGLLHAHFG